MLKPRPMNGNTENITIKREICIKKIVKPSIGIPTSLKNSDSITTLIIAGTTISKTKANKKTNANIKVSNVAMNLVLKKPRFSTVLYTLLKAFIRVNIPLVARNTQNKKPKESSPPLGRLRISWIVEATVSYI